MSALRAISGRGWLVFGSLACLSYGFWGFFDKLSTNINPYLVNTILYGVAFGFSFLSLLTTRRELSIHTFSAGLCSGVMNVIILRTLERNALLLTYPFISFGSAFFVLFDNLLEKPERTPRERAQTYGGVLIASIGLTATAIGLSGGFGQFSLSDLNLEAISMGLVISLLSGLWVLLTYRSVRVPEQTPGSAAFWILFGSFVSSSSMLLPSLGSLPNQMAGNSPIYPIFAGAALFFGEYSPCQAFAGLMTTSRVKEIIVAFLANGELLPLIFLSSFLLGERSVEGFVGAAMVILGLFVLHASEDSRVARRCVGNLR